VGSVTCAAIPFIPDSVESIPTLGWRKPSWTVKELENRK
jgi:hypothetical protein